MKLTDSQLVLLSAASQRQDGAVELGPNLKAGASAKVVGRLLRQHLIEEVPAQGSLQVWRRDENDGALALRVTERGLPRSVPVRRWAPPRPVGRTEGPRARLAGPRVGPRPPASAAARLGASRPTGPSRSRRR